MISRRWIVWSATVLAMATAQAAEDGFKSVFNGTSLDGWEGNTSIWSVKDGAITGTTTAATGLKHNTFLVWKGGTVGDFELRLSYRIVNGNSGIQYRSKVSEQGAQGPIVGGYQADFEAGKTFSGILYEERGRGILAQRGQKTKISAGADGKTKVEVVGSLGKSEDIQAKIKNEDWNDYVIIAKGNHLQHFINGVQTVDVMDEDAAKAAKTGVLALQVHVGPPMTVQAKNIRIKDLGGDTAAAGGNDLDKMQGEWVAVAGYREGEEIPEDAVKSIRLKVKGERYEVSWDGGGDGGKVVILPGKNPKEMNVVSDTVGEVPTIYELTDKEYKVAYGMNGSGRPKSFKPAAGSDGLSVTYRRKE